MIAPLGWVDDVNCFVATLKPAYNKGFFAGRNGVMQELDELQRIADQIQQARATGRSSPELEAYQNQSLGAALGRIITRLDGLVKSVPKPEQAAAALLLQEKLTAMRATLPGK